MTKADWELDISGPLGYFLACLTVPIAFFALMFRADTSEELSFGFKVDITVGVLFALAFLLVRISDRRQGDRQWKYQTALGVVLIWIGTNSCLAMFHAGVHRARSHGPKSATAFRIFQVQAALHDYARDCDAPPTEEQGLNALCNNPGVKNWRGPYLEEMFLTDGWGNAIQYGFVNGHPRVWSCGPDGRNGTDDDIIVTE